MNITYGALNGEPRAMRFVRHGWEGSGGVRDVLIFTDGLFLPCEDPRQERDWQGFIDLYRHQGGLRGVREHVRYLQGQDPGCRRYPRFKLHDDIAAIAINIDG